MKKISIISLIAFIICTAFNKPSAILADYRDAYSGSYLCKSNCEARNLQGGVTTNTDTITIDIVKDPQDSILQIVIGHSKYQVKLKNSAMYAYPEGAHRGGRFFATDSIVFTSSAGLGGSCSYMGKRK